MTNLLHTLKWFFKHPRLVLSVRFGVLSGLILVVLLYGLVLEVGVFDLPQLPAWVLLVLLGLMGLASAWVFAVLPSESSLLKQMQSALDQMDFALCETLIEKSDLFIAAMPSFKVQFGLLKASYFRVQSDSLAEYQYLQTLKARALLPSELCRVQCAFGFLSLEQGDLKAVRKTLERLKTANCQTGEAVRMLLLESRWHELSGNLVQAKEILEDGLSLPQLDRFSQALFLHQLALLESTQDNNHTALDYYQQAWLILLDLGKVQQKSNTASNLIFLYLRMGQVEKAQSVLATFAAQINPKLATQLITLHNIEIEFARQTGDRKRLLNAYTDAEKVILPLLDEQEKFSFLVMGLRMHWNDGVAFEAALVRAMQQMLADRKHTDLRNVFHAYQLVVGVLGQAIARLGARSDLVVYHGWIVMEWVRLQTQLDEGRNAVPAALPALRADCLALSLEGMKLRLNLFGLGLPKAEFDRLFALLAERKRIWADKENSLEQMQVLVVMVDEYLAYGREIDDPQFKADFYDLAKQALTEAAAFLQQHEAHPAFTQYFVGMAYFYSQFQFDKTQAKRWLEKFDAKGQSLNHYAVWLREHYQLAQDYVRQV